MQNYALDRVKISLPRCLPECSHCGLETGFPAHVDPGWSEIDIFSVILIFQTRRQEADNVHLRHASVASQFLHGLGLAHIIGQVADQLADDVRNRCVCCCRVMWLAIRLEYWMSF